MKLTREQIENLIGETVLDQKGANLYGTCPYCRYNEFGISLGDNHLFNCFRKSKCGVTGNIYTLLSFLGRAKEFIQERSVNAFDKLINTLHGIDDEIEQQEVDISLPQIAPPIFWKQVTDDEYLRSRGFADYQFNKFEVGRSKMSKDYITFLIRQEGKLVGYVGRSNKSKKEIDLINTQRREKGEKEYPRYNNSKTDFAKTLFGLDEIVEGVTTDVILVEGVLSKTKTDFNLGLDFQEHMKCCATFGAKLSEFQIRWLKKKKVKRLIFWFEADVLKKVKKITSQASLSFDSVLVCYLNGRDPNDLDQQQAFELLESSQDWFSFNLNYINSDLKQ